MRDKKNYPGDSKAEMIAKISLTSTNILISA